MNKIFHKNKLAIPGLEWLVLSRRGNATQISDAAWVARDANAHECVVTPGGHAPTRSRGGQGHPGAGAPGSAAQRRDECWEAEKNPKPRWAWQPCRWLFCSAVLTTRVQPYLGRPPTRCRDQIQSAVAKNDMKSDLKIPFKTSGFWESLPPSLSLQPKWANGALVENWISLQTSWSFMIRTHPLAWYYLHGSVLCHMRWLLFVSSPERWGVRHLWKSPSAEGSFPRLVETVSNALGKSQLRCNNNLMFHWPRTVTLAILLAICRDMVLHIVPFWQTRLFFREALGHYKCVAVLF